MRSRSMTFVLPHWAQALYSELLAHLDASAEVSP